MHQFGQPPRYLIEAGFGGGKNSTTFAIFVKNNTMKYFTILLTFAILLSSCKKETVEPTSKEVEAPRTYHIESIYLGGYYVTQMGYGINVWSNGQSIYQNGFIGTNALMCFPDVSSSADLTMYIKTAGVFPTTVDTFYVNLDSIASFDEVLSVNGKIALIEFE